MREEARDFWASCQVEAGCFLPLDRVCACMCVCVRGEKNLFSLFLARVKVTLFSPRGASLCGLNQSKFPLCLLLRGDMLLLSAGPLVTPSSAGLWANPFQIILELFHNRYSLPSPIIHPNLLGTTIISWSFYYHSDVLQMQTFRTQERAGWGEGSFGRRGEHGGRASSASEWERRCLPGVSSKLYVSALPGL